MTTKERMLSAVDGLPEDATIEDAMERLLLMAKLDRGVEEVERGDTFSHTEVEDRMAKWLR